MYRTYEEKIKRWINDSKKALLIYGARQVGKTYLIRKMLERTKTTYCEYNLIEREDVLQVLQNTGNPKEIAEKLALYSDVELTEGKSVVFLDEIQKYPDIVTKIKFLVDEGRYRYILSGSNLGIELNGIKSIPVGYVESFQMMPMTFEEFAISAGISKNMLYHMHVCFDQTESVDEIVHKKLLNTFYDYLVVGGMPAVVNIYNATHSLTRITDEQSDLVNQYKADFTKYEKVNKRLKIISIYDNIPAQLTKQDRRFNFTLLDKEMKFNRYEESFLWLKDAAVALPAYIVSEPVSPLKMSKETNVFKLFMSDVGLFTATFPAAVKNKLLAMDPENELNNGPLFENFFAEEAYASGKELFYYKKRSVGEVDFMVERGGEAVPVEIKSGKEYKKHAALDHLMEKHHFSEAYVLSANNVEKEDNITYLPIYMAGLVGKEKEGLKDKINAL